MFYDALLVPNLGIEVGIRRHFSVALNWAYAWWNSCKSGKYWRMYGGDVEGRYWFKPKTEYRLTGHHLGVYAQMLTYDIALSRHGVLAGVPGSTLWDYPTWGVGVSYGHSWRLGQSLRIDCAIGAGYLHGIYQKYTHEDDCYVWKSAHRLRYWGPTRAEVSLVWVLQGRKMVKKGGGHEAY